MRIARIVCWLRGHQWNTRYLPSGAVSAPPCSNCRADNPRAKHLEAEGWTRLGPDGWKSLTGKDDV